MYLKAALSAAAILAGSQLASASTILWSADFSSPDYTTNAALIDGTVKDLNNYAIGQQGWWQNQGYSAGYITPDERLRLGTSNGNYQSVYSPAQTGVSTDSVITVSLSYTPGGGSYSDVIYVKSPSTYATGTQVAAIIFNRASDKIALNGTDTDASFSANTTYSLVLIKDDVHHTLSLKVDGTTAVENVAFNTGREGLQVLQIVGGGGHVDGDSAAHYSYVDNIAVAVPEPATGGLVLLGGCALLLTRGRRCAGRRA